MRCLKVKRLMHFIHFSLSVLDKDFMMFPYHLWCLLMKSVYWKVFGLFKVLQYDQRFNNFYVMTTTKKKNKNIVFS